ncbi:hypothetical protein JYT36_00875 [Bacteroidales bacterium AH-315-N07]|nr:hypothetical protein [Bacteroidales bacterium AH-315-N07]
MSKEIIETRSSKLWLDDDGILRVLKKENCKESLDDAKQNITAIERLCGNNEHVALVDMTNLRDQDRAAIEYYTNTSTSAKCTACAILYKTVLSGSIALSNIYLGEKEVQLRIFTIEEEAIRWLKNQMGK